MTKTTKSKLTKTFIDSLPLAEYGQVIYRDTELPGFALRVTKTKSCLAIVERKIDGKTVRHTIGLHGVYTSTAVKQRAKLTRFLG